MRKFTLFALIVALIFLIVPCSFAGSLAAQRNVNEVVITNVAKALPASTQTAIFTIAGGPIEILSFTGEVTTVIETQDCNLKITADPTTPATDTDLCTVLNVSGDAVGTYYSLKTSIATALQEATNGVDEGMGYTIIVPIGAIDVNTVATNTGNITWRMRYRPLHPGVSVTAN